MCVVSIDVCCVYRRVLCLQICVASTNMSCVYKCVLCLQMCVVSTNVCCVYKLPRIVNEMKSNFCFKVGFQ